MLSLAASCTGSIISSEQRDLIDAAIRAAQPVIVGDPIDLDMRIMVCALHVVTAEWANAGRINETPSTNIVEAFLLMKMLCNRLDNIVLAKLLERSRAGMPAAQWHWLADLVNDFYPLNISPEPDAAAIDARTLH